MFAIFTDGTGLRCMNRIIISNNNKNFIALQKCIARVCMNVDYNLPGHNNILILHFPLQFCGSYAAGAGIQTCWTKITI